MCELFDASISGLCLIIWIRGDINCESAFVLCFRHWHMCVFFCILDMSSPLLSSPLHIAWANCGFEGRESNSRSSRNNDSSGNGSSTGYSMSTSTASENQSKEAINQEGQ